MFLAKCLLEVIQHQLEFLNISHTKLGHVLLELFFLIVNFVFQFNYPLSQSQLRCNGTLKGDVDANWELKIIKADIWAVNPLINECVDDFNIKERTVFEDLRLLLTLDQLLKSILTKFFI